MVAIIVVVLCMLLWVEMYGNRKCGQKGAVCLLATEAKNNQDVGHDWDPFTDLSTTVSDRLANRGEQQQARFFVAPSGSRIYVTFNINIWDSTKPRPATTIARQKLIDCVS